MVTTKNFKELKDGRFRLKLSDEIRKILIGTVHAYAVICMKTYEFYLTMELIEALEKPEIKLRRSEFFLLFSHPVIRMIPEPTQIYLNAWLDVDEIKRQWSNKFPYQP